MEISSGKPIWILITAVLLAILFISTTEAQNRFQRQQRFRPNNNNNFNFRRNNNNNGGGRAPQGQNGFAFGLDTSDGRYARFDGPVRGIPPGHGGGRFGAADCLLCGK